MRNWDPFSFFCSPPGLVEVVYNLTQEPNPDSLQTFVSAFSQTKIPPSPSPRPPSPKPPAPPPSQASNTKTPHQRRVSRLREASAQEVAGARLPGAFWLESHSKAWPRGRNRFKASFVSVLGRSLFSCGGKGGVFCFGVFNVFFFVFFFFCSFRGAFASVHSSCFCVCLWFRLG